MSWTVHTIARTHVHLTSTHTHTHTRTHPLTPTHARTLVFYFCPLGPLLCRASLSDKHKGDWGRGAGYPPTLTAAGTECSPSRYGCAVHGSFGPAWSVWRMHLRYLTSAAGARLHPAHSRAMYHVVAPPLVGSVAHASVPHDLAGMAGTQGRERQAQIDIRTSDSLVIGPWHLWWLEGERKKESCVAANSVKSHLSF